MTDENDNESGPYDPADDDDAVITMENVGLMPDWMGFSVLWAGALFLVCVALLFIPMVLFWFFPWQVALGPLIATIAFDVGLVLSALAASILTPSHEGTWKYLKSRRDEGRGRETIRSDPTLPSRRER